MAFSIIVLQARSEFRFDSLKLNSFTSLYEQAPYSQLLPIILGNTTLVSRMKRINRCPNVCRLGRRFEAFQV